MEKRTKRGRGLARAVAASVIAVAMMWTAGVASAHEQRRVGDHDVVVGWASEPAYAGFGNEVSVRIMHREDPVEDAELDAVVAFGGEDAETTTQPMPLEPAFGDPGHYVAYIIPTRPGTYSFHVTGTVEGEQFDETFTSGPDTFNDVQNPTDAEFPEQDPTRGEIAEALDRLSGRVEELSAEEPAEDEGSDVALWVAIGAAALALIALVLAVRRRPA